MHAFLFFSSLYVASLLLQLNVFWNPAADLKCDLRSIACENHLLGGWLLCSNADTFVYFLLAKFVMFDVIVVGCYYGDGRNYRGIVNVSERGIPCQSWSSQVPHEHSLLVQALPALEDAGNSCRNLGGVHNRPWCFTQDPNTRWQHCAIPNCGGFYLFSIIYLFTKTTIRINSFAIQVKRITQSDKVLNLI